MKLFCPTCHYPHEVPGRVKKGHEPACPHHGRILVTAKRLKVLDAEAAEEQAEQAQEQAALFGTPGTPRRAPFGARNDHLKPHYDHGAGTTFNSKSQREAFCKKHGLVLKSYDERLRNTSHNHSKPRAVSYRGQKHHRSSAEKGGVIDGHTVL